MANAITYIKNVGKSLGYASIDVLKEKNPVFHDFAETNGELATEMYRSVRDLKKTIKELPNKIMESEFGKFAETYKNNLLEDLKSGKFYNKERQDQYLTEGANAQLEGLDMSVFDDFGDGNSGGDDGFDLSELESDGVPSSNEMMDIVGEKSSAAVSMAVARSSEYIVEANTQAAKASYRQMNAIYGGIHTGMSTINQNISKVLEFANENLNLHIENSKTFYSKISEMDETRNQYLKEISETLKQVINPEKSSSSSSKTSYSDLISSEGVLDIERYKDYLKKSIKDNSGGIFDMLEMVMSTGGLQQLAASPLEAAATGIINYLIPKALDKSMENLNKSLSGMLGNALMGLKYKADNSENEIWRTISDIFGINTERKTSIDPSQYEKGRVPFDGVTRKAIIEVIPTYLSKILSALNGQERDTFDYDQGRFVTVKSLYDKKANISKNAAINAASELDKVVKEKAKTIKFDDKTDEEEFWQNWENAKQAMFEQQMRFETRSRKVSGSTYNIYNDKHFDLLRQFLDNTPENLNYANRMYRQIDDQNRTLANLQNSSSINAIYNDSTNSDNESGVVKISSIFGDVKNAIVDKLNEIHKEIAYIRMYGVGGTSSSTNSKPQYKYKPDFSDFKIPGTIKANKESETQSSSNKDESTTKSDEEAAKPLTDEEVNKEKEKPEDKKKKKKTLSERMKDLRKTALGIVQGPMNLAASVIDRVDTRLYELVYGPVGGREDREDDDRTLKEILFDNLQNQFDKFADWMEEKVFDPLKYKSLKENAHDAAKKFLGIFGIDLDKSIEGIKSFIFGEDEDGNRTKGGFLGKFVNDFKETFKSFGDWIKDGFKDTGDWTGATAVKSEKGNLLDKAFNATNSMLLEKYVGRKYKENGEIKEYTKEDAKNGKFVKTEDFIDQHATGARRINKTGLAILSEGELVIPDSMNPFDIAKRERAENAVKRNLGLSNIHQYDEGTTNALSENDNLKNMTAKEVKEKLLSYEDEKSIMNFLSKLRGSYNDDAKFTKFIKEVKYVKLDSEYDRKSLLDNSLVQLLSGIEYTKNTIVDNLSISKEDKDTFTKNALNFISDIKEHGGTLAAGAAIGGGISLLTGLVGGPLVGAAVGAGTALITKSETVQNMLFGNEEKGKQGLLPENLTKAIKKYLPDMGLGGAMGGILSLIPGIPGGPIAGMIAGSAIGFAKNSEKAQEMLFGEGKLLGKKEDFQKKIQSVLPKMGAGALAGLIAGPFGSIGANIFVGSALGFAADTNKFKDLMFGEVGKDGKRVGGLFEEVAKPMGKFFKDLTEEFREFIKVDIIAPVRDAIDPIRKQIELMFKGLTDLIGGFIKNHITIPLGQRLEKLANGLVGQIAGKLFDFSKGIFKWVVSRPSKIIGGVGDSLRRHQIKSGNADYMSAEERVAYRESKGWRMKWGDPREDIYHKLDKSMIGKDTDVLNAAEEALSGIALGTRKIDDIRSEAYQNISKSLRPKGIDYDTSRAVKTMIKNGRFEDAIDFVNRSNIQDPKVKENLLNTIKKESAKIQTSYNMKKDAKGTINALAKTLKDNLGLELDDKTIERLSKNPKEAEKLIKYIRSQKKYNEKNPEVIQEQKTDEFREKVSTGIDKITELLEKLNGNKSVDDEGKDTVEGGQSNINSEQNKQTRNSYEDAYDDITGDSAEDYDGLSLKERIKRRYQNRNPILATLGLAKDAMLAPGKVARKLGSEVIGLGFKGLGFAGKEARGMYDALRDTPFFTKMWGNRRTDWHNPGEEKDTPVHESKILSWLSNIFKNLDDNVSNLTAITVASSYNEGIDVKELDNNRSFKGKLKSFIQKAKNKFKRYKTTTEVIDGRLLEVTTDSDGNKIIDPTSSENRKELAIIEERENTQLSIATGLMAMPNTLGNLFTRFFGGNEEEESWFSKLINKIKTPVQIAAAFGALGWAKEHIFPGVKMFWDEKIFPYLNEAWQGKREGFGQFIYFFNPKNPDGLMNKIHNFVTNTLPGLLKTASTYIASGMDWAIRNVLPSLVSGLIKNIPAILKALGTGILDGLNALLHNDGITKNDGRMKDLDTIESYLGSNNVLGLSAKSTPSWFDKSVSFANTETVSKHLSVPTSTSSTQTKKPTIIDKIFNKKQEELPKAFKNMNQVYKDSALSEYEKVKDKVIDTPYGPMTVKDILNSDKQFGVDHETGKPIYGYEFLNYDNTAKQLGINVQLSNKDMERNTKEHGGGNESTIQSDVKNASLRSFLRGLTGNSTGVNRASKVVSGASDLVGGILQKVPGKGLGSTIAHGTGKFIEYGGKAISKFGIELPNAIGKGISNLRNRNRHFDIVDDIINTDNLSSVIDATNNLPDVITAKPSSSGIFGKFKNHAKNSKLGDFISKAVEALMGMLKDNKVVTFISKAISSLKKSKINITVEGFIRELGEKLQKQIPEVLGKFSNKLGLKASAKLAAYTASGIVLLIADAVFSFMSGYRNANSILGITEDPSIIVRVLCGIIEALNSVFLLGIVPLDTIVDVVVSAAESANLPVFDELKLQRESAKAEVDEYNKEHGTNFTSIEDYNKKDRITSKIKGKFAKIGNWISDLFKKDDEGTEITNAEINYENNEVTANGSGIGFKIPSKNKSIFGKGSGLFGRGSDEHDHVVEKPEQLGFISQVDPRYKNKKFNIPGDSKVQTLGDSGCAPAAAAMAINGTVGRGETMENASRLALKYKVKDDGVSASYFDDEFSRHGLSANYMNSSSKISNELMNNHKVVLMGQDRGNKSKADSPFGPNPHYVTATGMSMDGKYVYINDPEASRPNIKYSASKVLGASKLGIAAVAKGSKIASKFKKYVARGSYGPDTVQYKVWNALRAAGYNEIATAAAMGNIQHESGFRADAIEKGSGVGFGLVQWSYGRRTAMENYAKQKGVNPSSLEVQIEYLLKELQSNSGIWTKASSKYGFGSLSRNDWANGSDLVKATKAFMACFERPSYDSNVNHIDRRIEAANEYLKAFTGMSVDTNLTFDTVSSSTENMTTSSSSSPISGVLSFINKLAGLYGLSGSNEVDTVSGASVDIDTDVDTSSVSGNVSSNQSYAEKQKALVAKMLSVKGALKYAQGPDSKYPGSRNPDEVNSDGTRSGDCSSTVQWAYKHILGVDPGYNTTTQRTNANTYTVATSTNDESKLQLGDLLLKDGHVEMYAGNNTMIGHGGGADGKKFGPTVKTLDKSGKYNLVRRWVGFQGSGSGLNGRGAYDTALNYINSTNSDLKLPFEVENKPATLEYSTTSNVKDITPKYTSGNQTATKVKSNNNSSSNDMLEVVKSIVKLLVQIVTNTEQLNNIAKLLGDYITATTEASVSKTEQSKQTAVLAKQNLVNAMQNSSSSSGPDEQLMRLIQSVESIARQ